jgi:hypothetical protein
VAFVNSDFEGLIAAVRQRRNISQTQKWASISLGTLLFHLHQIEVKLPACQNGTTHRHGAWSTGAVGTAQRKQRNGRLKDQFHSLETALQRKDDRTVIVPAPRLCEGIGLLKI